MNSRTITEILGQMRARQEQRPESQVQLLLWDGPSAFNSARNLMVHGGWPDVTETLQLLGPKYEDADFRELTHD